MFITKKHLSRRTVLKAAGVSLSLPLLDAMIPAGTALAQTAAQGKLRAGFFYIPHGATMDKWTPAGTGTTFAMSEILARHPGVRALFDNGWLHLFALDEAGRMAWRYAGGSHWERMEQASPEGAQPFGMVA